MYCQGGFYDDVRVGETIGKTLLFHTWCSCNDLRCSYMIGMFRLKVSKVAEMEYFVEPACYLLIAAPEHGDAGYSDWQS